MASSNDGGTDPLARVEQLAYSDQQPLMLDETSRRQKAAKILRVVQHFLAGTILPA